MSYLHKLVMDLSYQLKETSMILSVQHPVALCSQGQSVPSLASFLLLLVVSRLADPRLHMIMFKVVCAMGEQPKLCNILFGLYFKVIVMTRDLIP